MMNLHETATQSDMAVLTQEQATHELEWHLAEHEPAAGHMALLEEVTIEEVSIDGMCGVY